MKRLASGQFRVQKGKEWNKQQFCSISCSKIHSNCMKSSSVRSKVSRALKAIGHSPKVRGGNGKLTKPQAAMIAILGIGWIAEHVIPVQDFQKKRLPKHLKVDIANPTQKIALEIDGRSHRSPSRRLQDARKTIFLAQSGWSVFRVSNLRAEQLCSTCMSADILLTSLTTFSSTTAT
jgi:hypothetical protein